METEVLEKGHVALPASTRRQLGIKLGDKLNINVQNGSILLSLPNKQKRSRKARIVTDPVTGLPVLDVGEDAPILTSEMVREMLADFP